MEQLKESNDLNEVAEVELIYKTTVKSSLRPLIKTSRDSFEILLKNWDQNKIELQEQFKILLLNRANRVLGIFEVSTGGITGTVADPRLIFAAALKANASSIIISHNHPSGNLQPSKADQEITQKIKEGGRLLDISVLDHIILTIEGYYSFTDEGLM